MTLTANQKKWKKYIEEKLKKYRMGKIMRKNSELLALMIAAAVKMYTDVNFNLSTMADSMQEVMDDPVFQKLVADPRGVAEYLQSPETVLKASQNMKHLFLESMEKSEKWFQENEQEFDIENASPHYVDLDDGTRLKMETSETLGFEWVNVSKVQEQEKPVSAEGTEKRKHITETPKRKPTQAKKKEKTAMLKELDKVLESEPEPVVEEIVNELSANDWALTF